MINHTTASKLGPPTSSGTGKTNTTDKERRAIEIYHILKNDPQVDQDKLMVWFTDQLGIRKLLRKEILEDPTLDEILGVKKCGNK